MIRNHIHPLDLGLAPVQALQRAAGDRHAVDQAHGKVDVVVQRIDDVVRVRRQNPQLGLLGGSEGNDRGVVGGAPLSDHVNKLDPWGYELV